MISQLQNQGVTSLSDFIYLKLESCKICKKKFSLKIAKEKLIPEITGTCQVADVHGLDHEIPHVRVLYVDTNGTVRSFTVIDKITDTVFHDK